MIEETLAQLLPENGEMLFEAARYSIEGGKRLRPQLTLAVLETVGTPVEKGLYPACAIEMIHAYSMIHDDLPCMDDDDLRRGKPTLHRVYPESHAVLTGDFLLTYAFEVIGKAPDLTDRQKNALVMTLASRGGSAGMIGGQVLDIEKVEKERLLEMHLKKTGALITAALEFGAIVAEVDLTPFQELGEAVGMAYQLVDDLLDGDGAVEYFGKEKTEEMVEELARKVSTILKSLPQKAPKLSALTHKMLFRTV